MVSFTGCVSNADCQCALKFDSTIHCHDFSLFPCPICIPSSHELSVENQKKMEKYGVYVCDGNNWGKSTLTWNYTKGEDRAY